MIVLGMIQRAVERDVAQRRAADADHDEIVAPLLDFAGEHGDLVRQLRVVGQFAEPERRLSRPRPPRRRASGPSALSSASATPCSPTRSAIRLLKSYRRFSTPLLLQERWFIADSTGCGNTFCGKGLAVRTVSATFLRVSAPVQAGAFSSPTRTVTAE